MSTIGGGYNNAAVNMYNSYNPTNWTGGGGGVGGKAYQVLDPFNLTGWNQKPTVDTAGAQPFYPDYNSPYDPNTMSFAPALQDKLNGINTSPLDMSVSNFADLANRQGPSAWATLADQQQNTLAENARERGGAETNAQTAQAIDTLGSSGGISSGARERAAEGGAKNYMNMSQDAARQNSLNQMQIGVNDQQNKMQEMGMLPGMEMQALQPEFQKANMWEGARQSDVTNAINSNNYANQFNMQKYQAQMQAWGAAKTADATQNAGKK